ncbi:MAG: phosphatase PAP2 family protein [Erysipelotrichales bacterium]|nr:phosphatase PAP2 family protein [Erysipelotrichales bacterium]
MKNKKIFFPIFGIVLIVFVLGLFFDLQFAQVIYSKNNLFAKIMAAIGETPAYGGLAFIGGGLFATNLKRENKFLKIVFFAMAFLCVLGGIVLSTRAMASHNAFNIEDKWYIVLPFALIIDGGLGYLGYRMCLKSTNEDTLKVLLFMLMVIAAVVLSITVLKRLWGRPRYRFIDKEGDLNLFRNWWEIHSGIKDTFINKGVSSDEFKSCPSGHTSSAACALLLMYLPLIDEKLKGKETLLLLIGAIWAGVVGFTRHILGAHFLTDTSFAYMITMLIILVLNYFFYKFKDKIKI